MIEFKSLGLSEYLVGTELGEKERERSNKSTIAKKSSLIEE